MFDRVETNPELPNTSYSIVIAGIVCVIHGPTDEYWAHQVLATDGETCTVLVEDDVGEVSVPVSHCKLRYEAGHAPLVDSCKGAIRRALKGCCQKLQRKSAVEIGPKQVHGENAT